MKTRNHLRTDEVSDRATIRDTLPTPSRHRAGGWTFDWLSLLLGTLLLLSGQAANAGLTFELNVYRYNGGYAFYTPMYTNAIPPDAPFGSYFVNSPHQPTNGAHREFVFSTNGFNIVSGGESFYGDFDSAKQQMEGEWSIIVTNETTTNHYKFTVSVPDLTSNLLPATLVTFPADGSTGVTNRPTFTWEGPTGWPVNGDASFNNDDYSYFTYASLPPTQSEWTPPDPAPAEHANFYLQYQTNYATSLVIASTPLNTNTAAALSGWATATTLQSIGALGFNVTLPPPAAGGLAIVAHYSFEDGGVAPHDFSGHGNHGSYAWFVEPPYSTNDTAAGSYAVGLGGSGWLTAPTNLLATLGGSFSVSLWLRTTNVHGNDDDSVFSAAGIVSAWNNDIDHAVMPMGQTGGKLAFQTGSGSGGALYSQASINTGPYIHLVVTRDDGNGEKKIYVNGSLDASDFGVPGRLDGGQSLEIGYNNGQVFAGELDEIQIYSGVLTPAEVTQLYQNPAATIPNRTPIGGHHLVAHHSFDMDGSEGQDDSGNGNDITGGAFWGPGHEYSTDAIAGGGALEFFGTSALWVSQPSQAYDSWRTVLGGSFTYSAWVKTTVQKGGDFAHPYFGATVIWAYNAPGNTNDTIPISITGSKVGFVTRGEDGQTHTLSSSPTVVNDGVYHHIAVTRDAASGEMRIYVDGNSEGTLIGTTDPVNAINAYYIGGSAYLIDGSGTNFASYIGLLDDVQIYSGVLSAAEVMTLYTNPGETVPDSATPGISLRDALDDPALVWTTGGTAPWSGQDVATHDNEDAAQSGLISHDQESWLETTVSGPGTISFWWKASCEPFFDFGDGSFAGDVLEFSVDGERWSDLSGDSDWQSFSDHIDYGTHTLRWRYKKDAANTEGADAGWVDQVFFDDQVAPDVFGYSGATTLFTGTNLVVSVVYYARPQPDFYWFKNGTLLPTQTTSTLTIPNAQTSDSGNYSVIVSNHLGLESLNFQVRVFEPTDLQPLSLTAPALAGSQARVPISWTATNAGPGTVSNWWDAVYLTTTTNGGPEYFMGQMFLSPFGTQVLAGATYSLSNLFRLPYIGAGDYRLLVRVDYGNGRPESNETNNQLAIPITIINPDIQPGALQASSPTVAGRTLQVTYNLTNNGPALIDGQGWNDHLVFSTDDQWSEDDINLLQPFISNPILGVGEFISRTNTVTLPTVASGDYYIVLRADRFGFQDHGQLWEMNETNNTIALPVHVTVPDLTPVSLVAKAEVSPRESIAVEWQLQNTGDATAAKWNPGFFGEWNDRLYLSTNQSVHAGSRWLGFYYQSGGQNYPWFTPLPAGQTMTNQQTIGMPEVAEGDYFLVLSADADNYVREVNETNNLLAVPIKVGSVDLVPASLTAPAAADAHSAIQVAWRVNNQGTSRVYPDWYDRLYLSTNNTYEAQDILLGEFQQLNEIPAGTNYSATNTVVLPGVAAGNYYLIFRVDSRTNILESNLTNNYLVRAINLAAPDLVAQTFNAPTNVASQQPITVSWSVLNAGATTAQPVWYDRIYLSSDTQLDGSDVAVGSSYDGNAYFGMVTALPVSGSYTQEVNVRVPAVPAGDYYWLLAADGTNAFTEANEANNFLARPVHVENPDLVLTNLIAPVSVTITQYYQRMEVGWIGQNQGTATVFPGWFDYLYLSPTNVFDTNAVFIGSGYGTSPLDTNQTYQVFATPSLPNNIEGTFYLLALADVGQYIYESKETNNLLAKPLQIVVPPVPDVSVVSIVAPVEALSGQDIEIRWVLTNRGNAAASGPFRDLVYLATTAAGDGLAQYGDFEFTGVIPPGGSVERVQHISLPINLSGQRWIYIVADAYNQLFEFTHKDNNSLIASQPMLVRLSPTPNLTVNEVTAPTEAFSGNTVLVTWAVTNQGTGPTRSPYWYDYVYLSTDTNFGNDTFIGYAPNAAYLAPGESYASAALVTLPRGVEGTHYFFVKADASGNVFEHTNENDNVTLSGPMVIHLTPPPDLQVATVNPPLSAFSGQPIQVSWSVTNYGLGQTLETAWYDRVYLSTNTTVDGNDPLIGTFQHVGGLEPGTGYRWTNTVNLPVGVTGNWYVLVACDAFGQVYEVPFDSNNQGTPAFATTIFLTPPPDLETTVLAAPTNALASHTFAVTYRVANEGTTITPNSGWADYLYLSADTNFDAGGDLYVGGAVRYSPLPPGDAYTNTITTTLPNGLSGEFYAFVYSDAGNAVFELDKTNNAGRAAGKVTILSQPADFAVRSLVAPTNIEVATAALVSWVVTNRADGDSAVRRWYDQLVLSSDNVAGNGDDVLLLTVDQFSVLGGHSEYAVNNATFAIPVTVAPGQYRLFLTTDRGNNVYEGTNEDNNVSAPLLINVTRTTADLTITGVNAPASATAGGSLSLNWTVRNIGNRNPSSSYWFDAVYLSSDRFFSPGDLVLGHRQNHSMLVPGASYTNALTASLPTGLLGDYYLVVQTDSFGHVAEPGLEDNNVYISPTPISIAPATAADLAVVEVNAPDVAYSGQTFDLTWAVTNAGNATASGSWYDAVYLSLDHFLDPFQDTYVGFAAHGGDVAAGGVYTNSGTFDVPTGFSGPYFVLVKSDSSGLIYEAGSEINNIGTDPQAMEVSLTPPVDLVAGPITIPANATPGVNATIDFTIFNGGSNTARGSWEDAIYISADTNYDVGDALFGRVKHKGDVAPGGQYTNTLTAPLPGILPGDYHVIVRSDILNHLVEQNRTNNLGASLNSVAIEVEPLVMDAPDTGAIAQGQSVYYRFNATAGETVRVRFTTGVPLAGNEMFVRFGQMPTRGEFDFAVNEPFVSDPDLFIPIEHTGTHYLLVYCGSMPAVASYSILAEILPFTVATVQPAIAGDKGETTFKVRGALFNPDTKFELLTDSNSVPASSLMLDDSTTAYVTFNLANQPQGYWNLKATMTETSAVASTLSNSVLVVSGRGPKVEVAIDGPLSVWAIFTQPVLLGYGNSGDSDAFAPLLLVYGMEGTKVGVDPSRLQSEPLEILGRSLEGPPDRLRPQSSHSHRLVYRGGALHVRTRAVRSDDTRLMTDADWLEIESSVRPVGIGDGEWLAFWSGIRPRVGEAWGDYVKFLNRIADGVPAEQRVVRDLIGTLLTNQPNFRASASLSGVVLGSTNNAPLPDVELGFYLVTTNGAAVPGGTATTDAGGQFVVPHIQPGKYLCVAGNTPFTGFDMNRDGQEDTNSPVFTVAADSDLANQTIYLHQPVPRPVITNDTEAVMVADAQGVLHAFWHRQDQLWHAWNDAGTWVDAAPITTNIVGAVTVAAGRHLLDGSTPGVIVVWSEGSSNRVDLLYSVGQTNGSGYRWSQPLPLTSDLVVNASPSVVVRADGRAIISYLKFAVDSTDDTDVYYSGVNVASGALLWNVPAPRPELAKVDFANKQKFKWAKNFLVKPLGNETKLTIAGELSGEIGSTDCSGSAIGKFEASAKVETAKGFLKGSLAGDLGFGFYVDPDECEWAYREGSATGNLHGGVTIGFKNIIFRVLDAYPPTAAFSVALDDFMRGFGDWLGVEFENSLELGAAVHMNGITWDGPPISSWGAPKVASADAEINGVIKFGAKYIGKTEINPNPLIDLNNPNPDKTKFSGTASLQISATAQFYPEWKPKNIKITPTVEISFPSGRTYSPNVIPVLVIDLTSPKPYPTYARDTNFFAQGTLAYKPQTAIGTTNVHGANSVLANVGADLFRDGAPALALDGFGVPYQIWYRELDPYGPDYGSDLRMADYTGAGWTPPTVIANTKGFNSQVVAGTDPLGHRLAIWVHGDASSITTNSTAAEFFTARSAVNLHYAVFDGASWSSPQPVVATDGPDSDVQVSTMTNGDLLVLWTYTDTNSLVHLLSASWNGTSWTVPQEVATGRIRLPAAQQIAGATYLLWTDTLDTNRNKGLFESVNLGGGWSPPAPFSPKPAARPAPAPVPVEPFRFAEKFTTASLLFGYLGTIPDKCCECKGKTKPSVTNGVDQGCGIALVKYDYKECRKYYEFKACPRVSMDPNDIVGPAGFGPEKWVSVGAPLNYLIRFENDPLAANAPAKQVIITLPLDADFNPATFRLGSFGFGDLNVNVPDGLAFYQTTLDLTEERGFYLDFTAGVDVAKREAFWRLTTIDPATGFLPLNPLLGFLPPNDTSPEGEGFVNFSIRPRSATATGAHADAKATIVFDTQPPIDTPAIFNAIDAGPPASAVLPLPAATYSTNFNVVWSGEDAPGESGLAGYDVYVSQDGGDYTLWLADTTLSESPFVGEYGSQYSFYSVAKDNAGNTEGAPLAADATILVASLNTPPVLAAVTNRNIPALVPFTLPISVTDTDTPPQSFTFEVVTGPAGLTIGATNGVVEWTPAAAQGPSTNPVTLRVTDSGVPPLSNTVSFTLYVLAPNTAPVFAPATNLIAPVLQLARTRVQATDAETNAIAYSFGPNPPATATLHPQLGDFRWTPPLAAAGTSNLITVLATDNGTPPLTATQQFVVAVPHYVQVTLGQTNLFAGQTGSVPVRVTASAPWRGLSFGLELPAGALDGLSLSNVVSPFTAATLLPVDALRSLLAFTNEPGHELSATQQVASLVFHASSPVSASVPLVPQNFSAALSDVAALPTLLLEQGRVIIVAEQPVLDAFTLVANRHQLRLYGNPGETYEIQTATNLAPPIFWLPFTDLVLSNIVQTVEGDTNSAPFRIYRAVKQ